MSSATICKQLCFTCHGPHPFIIQDDKGTGVSFRNLWIIPLVNYDTSLGNFRKLFDSGTKNKDGIIDPSSQK